MSYYHVLGYRDNPIVKEYFDKYFTKLSHMLEELEISPELKEKFAKKTEIEKYKFLCNSDISTLVQRSSSSSNSLFLEKLEKEFELFLTGKQELCIFAQGSTIPGTDIKLTLIESCPQTGSSTHPDHKGNMLSWGEKSEEEWMSVYERTFSLLKEAAPEFYEELNSIIQKIVPFNTSYGAHNSCSYKFAVGNLYLGYAVDNPFPELSNLEAIIHESSHNKLNLIMQSGPLIRNDMQEKYYSPYRPDARHIHGIYLGVHALVPTAYIMLELIEKGYISDVSWMEKMVLFHIKNKIGFKVLQKYADCTPMGKKVLDEIEAVMNLCDQKIKKNKDLQRLNFQNIQQQAKKHFLEVQRDYGFLQY